MNHPSRGTLACAAIACALAILSLYACGSPKPLPEATEFASFDELEAQCRTVHDEGRPVRVSGTLQLHSKTVCTRNGLLWCNIYLRQQEPLGQITIYVEEGRGNNEMQLPVEYTADDLKVYADSGEVLGAGDLVTVTGWISSSYKKMDYFATSCRSLYIVKIERASSK